MTLEARSRWSYAARCPRMGALALLGAEPAPPTDTDRRLWLRGKQIGAYVGDQLAEKFGSDAIMREKVVHWPGGIGHADVFVKPEALTVEAKSRTSLEVEDADVLQLGGYMRFDPEAERGALFLVHPSDLEERVLPVLMTPELRDRVDETVDAVVRAGQGGPLPDCVCDSPGACRANFCPFTAEAWAGWQPPDPIAVQGEVAEVARELLDAEWRVRSAKQSAGLYTEEREKLRARLRDLIEPGVDYVAQGIKLRRIVVKPRVTYDIPAALKGGILSETQIGPFRKVGRESERWFVEALGDQPAPAQLEEYGDVPF